VGFLKTAPGRTVRAGVSALSTPQHRFEVHGREIYWLRASAADEYVGPKFDKSLGPATFRNITTVRKLAVKYCGTAGETKSSAAGRKKPSSQRSAR
jgi:hypothetical protein